MYASVEHEQLLWLQLQPAPAGITATCLSEEPATLIPPRDGWTVSPTAREKFRALLNPYANGYLTYRGDPGQHVLLRVDSPPDTVPPCDIWALLHPNSRKHLMTCGWSLAETTYGTGIDVNFHGCVVVDGAQNPLLPALDAAFKKVGLDATLVGIDRTGDIPPGSLLVSSTEDGAHMDKIRLHLDFNAHDNGTPGSVVIWTRMEPPADDKVLVELFPAVDPKLGWKQAHAAAPNWIPALIRLFYRGHHPDRALSLLSRSPLNDLKDAGFKPGHIRLRNVTNKFDARPYSNAYYDRHVGGRLEQRRPVQVLVSPAENAKEAGGVLHQRLDEERKAKRLLLRLWPEDLSPTKWLQTLEGLVCDPENKSEQDEDDEDLPIWIVHVVKTPEAVKQALVDHPDDGYVNQIVTKLRALPRRTTVYLVVDDPQKNIEDLLAGRWVTAREDVTILARIEPPR